MTVLEAPAHAIDADQVEPSWIVRHLGPAWPLKVFLLGFPLWWALGLAGFIGPIAALVMAVQMLRRRTIRVPVGFGLWLLFMVWMLAGVFVLWAHAPGTEDGGGAERLIPWAYRVLWYLAATVAMLYPLNVTPKGLPSKEIARWMGVLFMYCVIGGLAGVVWPHFEFRSPVEMILPSVQADDFLYNLVHPALTTSSEFLGYEQPRPKAPFAYANSWGNNVGLLMPFFVYSAWSDRVRPWWRWLFPVSVGLFAAWVAGDSLVVGIGAFLITFALDLRRWPRLLVLLGLGLSAIPIAYSLNRGLWIGIAFLVVAGGVALVRTRRYTELWVLAVAVAVSAMLIVLSPLWATIQARIAHPHSNERRLTVAEVVTSTTWHGSPVLGFGTTRKVTGNFESIAGGSTDACHQCAAPPLGTQGFMWRLIFTTGFVGTAIFFAFVAVQLWVHIRRREAMCLLGCLTLVTGSLYFFVYDSLEGPLTLIMLAVGLMNRERIMAQGAELTDRAVAALARPSGSTP